MKIFLTFIVSLFTLAAPVKEKLYECANMVDSSKVDRVFILSYKRGTRVYYELNARYFIEGIEYTLAKRLTLTTKYDGNIEQYSRGSIRVKIDKARSNESKYSAFVRIPQLGIHSADWTCKDF
jgi:hypothetical protein